MQISVLPKSRLRGKFGRSNDDLGAMLTANLHDLFIIR